MDTEVKLSEDQQKVFDFLKPRGDEGATAVQIATGLGLSLEGDERKKSLTKVRRITRNVVDRFGGNKATNSEGREKTYSIKL